MLFGSKCLVGLGLGSAVYAEISTKCVASDVCFSLSIPASTASSGNGDIYVQLAAPIKYSWVGLGQGTRMSGANYMIIYSSGDGQNVTLSPRLISRSGSHEMPEFNSAAQVSLLEGSGISNGVMIANIKCSSCQSWEGGTMDLKSDSTEWIFGFNSDNGLRDDSPSAVIAEHDRTGYGSISFDSLAKGGSDPNPFLNAAAAHGCANVGAAIASPSASQTASTRSSSLPLISTTIKPESSLSVFTFPTATRRVGGGGGDDDDFRGRRSSTSTARTRSPIIQTFAPKARRQQRSESSAEIMVRQAVNGDCNGGQSPLIITGRRNSRESMLVAHAVLACLAFGLVFPLGGIMIHIMSFKSLLWTHGILQVFGFITYSIAFGFGLQIALHPNSDRLHDAHPIIGILLFCLLSFQAPLGYIHHAAYKQRHTRTIWSHLHLWIGRSSVLLGIVNGGLGFRLSNHSRTGSIIYGVFASLMGIAYAIASLVGERRRANRLSGSFSDKFVPPMTPSKARWVFGDAVLDPVREETVEETVAAGAVASPPQERQDVARHFSSPPMLVAVGWSSQGPSPDVSPIEPVRRGSRRLSKNRPGSMSPPALTAAGSSPQGSSPDISPIEPVRRDSRRWSKVGPGNMSLPTRRSSSFRTLSRSGSKRSTVVGVDSFGRIETRRLSGMGYENPSPEPVPPPPASFYQRMGSA